MPRTDTSKPLATPGDTTPKGADTAAASAAAPTPASVAAASKAAEGTDTGATPSGAAAGVGKVTAPLKGTPEEREAAREAEMAEMRRMVADMQRQLNAKAPAPAPAVKLPTVAEAKEQVQAAATAEGRKPVLTHEGWYVHPHAYEAPNADLAAVLAKLGAGASMPVAPVTAATH